MAVSLAEPALHQLPRIMAGRRDLRPAPLPPAASEQWVDGAGAAGAADRPRAEPGRQDGDGGLMGVGDGFWF